MTTEEKIYRWYIRKHNARLYNIWRKMKQRCYNNNDPKYKNYGARGICICDEWKHDFILFYNWAIENGYRDELTIDRIDVDGNYEPDNCQWATPKQQARNTTKNRNYTINGETHCLSEWCEILNLRYKTVYTRIFEYNWPIKQALELEERRHD